LETHVRGPGPQVDAHQGRAHDGVGDAGARLADLIQGDGADGIESHGRLLRRPRAAAQGGRVRASTNEAGAAPRGAAPAGRSRSYRDGEDAGCGISAGFTYVSENGPMPCTCTTVLPRAMAKWCAFAGAVMNPPAVSVWVCRVSTESPIPTTKVPEI